MPGPRVNVGPAPPYTWASMPRQIDYRLARKALLRELRRGRLGRVDVCDAHPELLRAANYVGEHSNLTCPICEKSKLRLVSYVYGDDLRRANGRCITSREELAKLGASVEEMTCYVIEVCVDCSWNHLVRSYALGRGHVG